MHFIVHNAITGTIPFEQGIKLYFEVNSKLLNNYTVTQQFF